MSVQVASRLGNWSMLMICVHCTFLQKVQGTPRFVSRIPWLLWVFRSVTPLGQGPTVLPNHPCVIEFHPEQLNKPCTTMRHLVLPCACSTKSWHCAHDRPPKCTGIECPMPPINFYSVHYSQCLKASLLAIRSHM